MSEQRAHSIGSAVAAVLVAPLVRVLSSPISSTICAASETTATSLASTARNADSRTTAPQSIMNVLVPVADASEDIELACITDVLVRAGATVVTASVMPEGRTKVKLARGLTVVADCTIKECVGKQWDAIALPGGMPGAEHLRDSAELKELLLAQASAGKCVGAVCASPAVVFGTHGLLPARATCFPVDKFKAIVGTGWEDSRVVLDGNVITSQVLRTPSRSAPHTCA